jgi:hypothetical protein
VPRLENLRCNTEAIVARFLDAAVQLDITVVDDKNHEHRRCIVPVASLVPCVGHKLSTIREMTCANPRLLAVSWVRGKHSTMAFVDLNQLRDESVDCSWWWRVTTTCIR